MVGKKVVCIADDPASETIDLTDDASDASLGSMGNPIEIDDTDPDEIDAAVDSRLVRNFKTLCGDAALLFAAFAAKETDPKILEPMKSGFHQVLAGGSRLMRAVRMSEECGAIAARRAEKRRRWKGKNKA